MQTRKRKLSSEDITYVMSKRREWDPFADFPSPCIVLGQYTRKYNKNKDKRTWKKNELVKLCNFIVQDRRCDKLPATTPKTLFAKFLHYYIPLLKLQRYFKSKVIVKLKAKQIIEKHIRNNRCVNRKDPITFQPISDIGKNKLFKFINSSGRIEGYDIETLVNYMLTTNKFISPLCRQEFNEIELKRIDKFVTDAKLELKSVYEAKQLYIDRDDDDHEENVMEIIMYQLDMLFEALKEFIEYADEHLEIIFTFHYLFPQFQESAILAALVDKAYTVEVIDEYLSDLYDMNYEHEVKTCVIDFIDHVMQQIETNVPEESPLMEIYTRRDDSNNATEIIADMKEVIISQFEDFDTHAYELNFASDDDEGDILQMLRNIHRIGENNGNNRNDENNENNINNGNNGNNANNENNASNENIDDDDEYVEFSQ